LRKLLLSVIGSCLKLNGCDKSRNCSGRSGVAIIRRDGKAKWNRVVGWNIWCMDWQ